MMKKNLLFVALALTALSGCTSDEFVGDQSLQEANQNGAAIQFNMNTPAMTRSTSTEVTALNSNFVVFGYKTTGSTDQTVFDNYQVNYVNNTQNSTESNSAGWEYVNYTSKATTPVTQSIKYWDYSASSYDFFAYSLGGGSATASVMTNSTYTLTGTQAQLGSCYISKKEHKTSLSSSSTQVTLQFMNFLSKIQLKFYETIPGYSVKDVKFYIADDTKSDGTSTGDGLAPALYTTSTIPTGGTYTITFDTNYDPVVALTTASSTATSVQFDPVTPATIGESPTPAVWLEDYAGKDYQEANEAVYLGRTSNAATASKQISVLPNSTGAIMTLKVDYTLLSRDGTGETIQVTGATATVPADFTKWKPNYAYTYIFKISDNTDGSIGTETGLYPITFDASVITDVAGNQTTITTVATPSITTYQNGVIANEYSAVNGAIYVVVDDGTTALTTDNAKLYTATIEAGAAQGIATDGSVAITEAMVENALANGATDGTSKVVTDANSKKLTVTTSNALSILGANETVGGVTFVSSKAAKFTPADNTVYVFEYIDSSSKKHYKVIKVGTPTAVSGS